MSYRLAQNSCFRLLKLPLTRVSWLPKSYTSVAWLDCDILFENQGWARDTVRLLEEFPLVQSFETCNRLPEGGLDDKENGEVCSSFGAITPPNPEILRVGHYEKHGHVGYGWAMRRELFDRHGLYEHAIMGSADHYMAHAAYGDFDGLCVARSMSNDSNQLNRFRDWAEPFYGDVQGKVSVVPGNIFHLWHGDLANRRYLQRNIELTASGFNPYTDVIAVPGKPLEWRPGLEKPELVSMFGSYFDNREEDGSSSTIK